MPALHGQAQGGRRSLEGLGGGGLQVAQQALEDQRGAVVAAALAAWAGTTAAAPAVAAVAARAAIPATSRRRVVHDLGRGAGCGVARDVVSGAKVPMVCLPGAQDGSDTATDGPARAPGDRMGAAWKWPTLRVTRSGAARVCQAMEAVGVLEGARRTRTAQGVDPLVVALFTAEAGRLVSLARFFVDDQTAAEDLVQEAFIRLLQQPPHPRRGEGRGTCSIVINLAATTTGAAWSPSAPATAVLDEPSAETARPTTSPAARRRRLAPLPKRQRDCVALRYLELPVPRSPRRSGSRSTRSRHLQRGLRAMATTPTPNAEEER